jgi:Ser/Thr protein kinase RdoA (MazF antagonist)
VQPALGTPFASLRPLAGGFSGETFVADAGGQRTVVRVYAESGARRGPDAPEVDAAVLHLVRGLVPVPTVLEVRRGEPEADVPGLLVTSFVPGERLDLLLPTLDDDALGIVGTACGDLAGRLACMPMPRPGVLAAAGDGSLVVAPLPPGWQDLEEYAEQQRAVLGLDEQAAGRLLTLARAAQDRLDRVGRASLVHSDLNPKNLLVDPDSLAVTALLDWEFAHAGSPLTDVGNLLRFERQPAFRAGVLAGYRARVPDAPPDLERAAEAADLWALLELAGRRRQNRVGAAAYELLLARLRGPAAGSGEDPASWTPPSVPG